jgi:hypothetical protein
LQRRKAPIYCEAKHWLLLRSVGSVLSPAQLQRLTGPPRSVRWAPADVAKAVLLRKISRRAYRFLLRRMHWPLPSEKVLNNWIRTVPAKPGFQSVAIHYFSIAQKQLDRFNRVVLSFDEIYLDGRSSCSGRNKTFYVGCNKAHVMIVRGLFCCWKQVM